MQVVFPLPMIKGGMFLALTKEDSDKKTPLHLAIENNHLW